MNRLSDAYGPAFLLLCCCLVGGCDAPTTDQEQTSMDDLAALVDQPDSPPADTNPPADQPESEPADSTPVYAEAEVVTSKSPKRGRSFHGQGGYANAVFSARFQSEHKLIFMQVKQALDLYQAEHGKYPESHEQFMEKIIEPNMIKLPELMEGHEYWYDASDHQLKERQRLDGAADEDVNGK